MAKILTARTTFREDERGAVAILFGLMFVVLAFAAGVAVDYSRIESTRSNFAAAVDAAALAAGRALLSGASEGEAEAIALRFFQENIGAGGGIHASYSEPTIDVDAATGGVTVSVTPVLDMTLSAVMGYEQVPVPVSASTNFESKDIELGIQLDLTGSMCDPCSKITALKDATKKLLEILMPDGGTPNLVRVGFAPYSAGVNVGTYADAVINNKGGSTCAYDRAGASAATDNVAVSGDKFQGKGDLPGAGGCPSSKIIPLTSEKDVLKGAINGFSTGGSTAGQLGTNWAWNLVSPKWNAIWPTDSQAVPYGDSKTIKAVILMTDGEYNTFEGRCDGTGCNPYGTRGQHSNDNAKAMCAKMKDEGVVVYTVGFFPGTPHPEAVETLNSCASSTDHYFIASDATDLTAAFTSIASQLSNLRLTN